MANTRQSSKRAKQEEKRNVRNTSVRSATKSAVKSAVDAVKTLDVAAAKEAYTKAIRVLAKAASKGAIPKGRASRKISRLTLLLAKSKSAPAATATAKTGTAKSASAKK